jgi:EAL domain-containing protein (putative c-di-GMP-specific phosphodiesterase class I)
VVYDPSMHADLLNRLDLEADLRRAIRDGGLFLVYQPTVSVATGQITGVEALVRWQHPERGVLLPTEFIPLAEETGLIYPLGEWVLREACRQAKQWQDEQEQEPLLSINVNISGRQVEHAEFPGLVREVLAETELEPSSLILEITESVLMDDSDRNQERLTELKDMGIRLAIDDFGTGYSSLRYLHRFPVDLLKIDRSFIQPLGTGSAGEEFVQTILRLGETLHVATVAEGIEDHRQLLALRRLGCPQAQGYYLGRPTDASSIASMLSEQAQQAPAV